HGGLLQLASDIGVLHAFAVTWEDLEWIREIWPGKLIVKGIHNANDALRAAEIGATAVIVSNHGGRQLDRVLPTLEVLRSVAPALCDSDCEVLMDGGIRSGGDIAIALALGAKAVLVGRAYVYGLGAAGEAGVRKSLEILRDELEHTMRQLGVARLEELKPSHVLRASEAGKAPIAV
ncbi:MAG: alpha-hydroxy acid oxidase, partial [Planctomycetota bacterium]